MRHYKQTMLVVAGVAISVLVLSEIEGDKLLYNSEHTHEQVQDPRIPVYGAAVAGTTASGDYIGY
ncbi:MAG: hypothetical protein V1682_00450 [Candidatus Omnitrophota bacterium]